MCVSASAVIRGGRIRPRQKTRRRPLVRIQPGVPFFVLNIMKKIILLIAFFTLLLSAGFIFAASVIQRNAPQFLRSAIEKSLNKKVIIRDVVYHFPRTFELQGFEIHEKGEPFDGEPSFYVEHVILNVSPMIFSRKVFVISDLELRDADIAVRKLHGKIYHAFSGVRGPKAVSGKSTADPVSSNETSPTELPLKIHQFRLNNCHFQLADYDTPPNGFVMTLDKINGKIKEIQIPSRGVKTSYSVEADFLQGRGARPAKIKVDGWTDFDSLDTDAVISLKGAHLPYFEPYYRQVTGAFIEDGFSDVYATLKMERRVLDLNMGFELSGLLFRSYEGGDELFGLKAEDLLSFLKDSSGRLKFQIMVEWNTSEKSVKLQEVFRRSIERSLRETILGNVGNILMNALQKVTDGGVSVGKKGNVEERIKKIKDFFKY